MRQSTRLILNTLASFGRMAITFGIGLVVTRLLIQWLGVVDFGLLMALGATGVLMQMLSESLTQSVQRHLAYELGTEDPQRLREAFNTALATLLGAAVVAWVLGQALASPILSAMTIPADRADAAWWVYQATILNVALTIAQTPFKALATARQALVMVSAVQVLTSVLRLGAVLGLLVIPGDPLIVFVLLMVLAAQISRSLITGIALVRFPESRPRPGLVRRSELGRIGAFAGWSMVISLGWRARMQGGLIILNIFFGPAVNAGYALAMQVFGYLGNFAEAVRQAIQPALVSAEGRGNRAYVHTLTLLVGKYAVIALAFLMAPVWLEAGPVLRLWLGEVPPYAPLFVRLLVIFGLMQRLSYGYAMAIQAEGDIGWFARWFAGISLVTLGVAVLGFWLTDLPPWGLPAAAIVAGVGLIYVKVVMVGRRIDLSPMRWVRECVWPTLAVVGPAFAVAWITRASLAEGPWRIALVAGAYAVVAGPLTLVVGMKGWERRLFWDFARRAVGKMRLSARTRTGKRAFLHS